MTENVLVQVVTTLGVVVVAVVQALSHRRLKAIGADAKEARDQTANTHSSNLREDMDKIAADAKKAAVAAERAAEHTKDVDESVRALRHSVDRKTDELAEHISDLEHTIPQRIDRAIGRHERAHHKEHDT